MLVITSEHEVEDELRRLVRVEEEFGAISSEVLEVLDRLGAVQFAWGLLPEALDTYRRALSLADQLHGGLSAASGEIIGNVGLILRELGNLREAESHFRQAIAVLEDQRGPSDVSVGRAVADLGALLLDKTRESPDVLDGATQ